MSFSKRNHLSSSIHSNTIAKVVMFLFLIFMVMHDLGQATRPVGGGTNPKDSVEKAVSFPDRTPVTPSGPNPCTYIPIPGEPCHPH
ncbi:hypothetical protein I3843_04G172800 [Carya illinoinensis]|nr:hypothetical protein I3843_04G172800 [Carya illinoinensis]